MSNKFTPNEYVIQGEICKIVCRDKSGEFTDFVLIDATDMPICLPYKWYILNGACYTPKVKRLHNHLLGFIGVDHINRNPLDNRRSNLRSANKSQNGANVGLRKDSTSGFKGVSFDKLKNKWKAYINIGEYGRQSLGYFTDKIDAAKAYNEAAIKYFGEFAGLNPV